MHEDGRTELISPDGRYRVTLEDTSLHGLLPAEEVSEVDNEGLGPVTWRDRRTLVVQYSCPKDQLVFRRSGVQDPTTLARRDHRLRAGSPGSAAAVAITNPKSQI